MDFYITNIERIEDVGTTVTLVGEDHWEEVFGVVKFTYLGNVICQDKIGDKWKWSDAD